MEKYLPLCGNDDNPSNSTSLSPLSMALASKSPSSSSPIDSQIKMIENNLLTGHNLSSDLVTFPQSSIYRAIVRVSWSRSASNLFAMPFPHRNLFFLWCYKKVHFLPLTTILKYESSSHLTMLCQALHHIAVVGYQHPP